MPEAAAAAQRRPLPGPKPVRSAAVTSVGAALPDTVVTSAEIAEHLGIDEHWILKRVGIRERRRLAEDETLAELATAAGRTALERAGIAATDLDLVICATQTGDAVTPATSSMIAHHLGAGEIATFDVGAACAGYLTGLSVAASQIESGRAEHALVIGCEAMSRVLDSDDRRTAALFGDGAGASVVSVRESGVGVGPSVFHSAGEHERLVYVPRGGDGRLQMEGQETFTFAVRALASATREVLERAELGLDDIDVFAYHQANGRITSALGARLDLGDDPRVLNTIETTGNTSAASIPLALDDAYRRGQLQAGSRVLMASIGAGYVWGAMIVDWG